MFLVALVLKLVEQGTGHPFTMPSGRATSRQSNSCFHTVLRIPTWTTSTRKMTTISVRTTATLVRTTEKDHENCESQDDDEGPDQVERRHLGQHLGEMGRINGFV